MSSVRIELNGEGIRELLRSEGVQNMLMERGGRVAKAVESLGIRVGSIDAGGEDIPLPVKVVSGRGRRARANVIVEHPAALAVEVKHRALVGSLDAARE